MKNTSVVIPNYNGIKYIGPCLDSLQDQCREEKAEVIVVDNGSQDGSVSLIEEKYPWVRLIRLEENTGFCHAVNVGIRASKTEYVLLLNNDTLVKPGFVTALEKAIEQDSMAFSVSGLMLDWDKEGIIDGAGDRYCALGWAFARGKGRKAEAYSERTEVFSACGGAAIYRRAIFEEIGYFDEAHFAYLEDVDIGYRAKVFGYRNLYEPEARVLHAGSASSGSRYNLFKTRLASANSIYLIWKNMPLLQMVWNLPFLLVGFGLKALFFARKGMGSEYIKGLMAGVKKCRQNPGARVRFRMKNMGNHLRIQWELYVNMVRWWGKG